MINMTGQLGKFLIIIGAVLVISGIIFILINRFINLDDFPGTITIQSGNFRLFIPILASILLSLILTIVINLVIRLINK